MQRGENNNGGLPVGGRRFIDLRRPAQMVPRQAIGIISIVVGFCVLILTSAGGKGGGGAATTQQPISTPSFLSPQNIKRNFLLDFEMSPLPTPLQQLPNKMQDPSLWAGANWGPVNHPVDWSIQEGNENNSRGRSIRSEPLWQRELETIRHQHKSHRHDGGQSSSPHHRASQLGLDNGDVMYAKHLAIFRAAPEEDSTVLEVGRHPRSMSRPTFFNFFAQYLPRTKYLLFGSSGNSSSSSATAVGGGVDGGSRGDHEEQEEASLSAYLQRNPSSFVQRSTADGIALEDVQKKFESVDIIIGRAADGIPAQVEAFRYFFVNMLRPGGVYFIEDIDMNFLSSPETDAAAKSRTLMIDYLRDMISGQIIHDWYMTTAGEYRAEPVVNNWVQDISCSRGSCAITKKLTPFNRFLNLIHVPPAPSDYAAPFATRRPVPLSDLADRDTSENATWISQVGPMYRPVKFGAGSNDLPLWARDANVFKKHSDIAGSDKCASVLWGHQFHGMYAKALAPWRRRVESSSSPKTKVVQQGKKQWKMLEVGLGCDTLGEPAAGYRLWLNYIPNVEYNVFEFKWPKCRRRLRRRPAIAHNLKYLTDHVFEGDQSNNTHLQKCTEKFGPFDIIVDDGSHVSHMMISTFREMFVGALKPGGIFVIEDIQTSFFNNSENEWGQSAANQRARLTTVDVIRDMIVSLNYPSWNSGYHHKDVLYRADEPVQNWVEDIMCSREACVVQKRMKPLSHTKNNHRGKNRHQEDI